MIRRKKAGCSGRCSRRRLGRIRAGNCTFAILMGRFLSLFQRSNAARAGSPWYEIEYTGKMPVLRDCCTAPADEFLDFQAADDIAKLGALARVGADALHHQIGELLGDFGLDLSWSRDHIVHEE